MNFVVNMSNHGWRMRCYRFLLLTSLGGLLLTACETTQVDHNTPSTRKLAQPVVNSDATESAREQPVDSGRDPSDPSNASDAKVAFKWSLEPEPPRDTSDDGVLFFGEGTSTETREAAVEAAVASALAEASRTRDSRIKSVIESRSTATNHSSSFSIDESIRLDSTARFSGSRTIRQEEHKASDEYQARLLLRVDRDQVFIGDSLKAIWSEPEERHSDLLHSFINAARSRGDSDAQALGLQQVLIAAPVLDDVLELVGLLEDKGFTSKAHKLSRRWKGRVDDPGGQLNQREAQLERDLISPQQLVAQLLISLEGARRDHTNLATSSAFLERHGARASMRLYGKVRAQTPLSFLWIDAVSISAPSNLVISPAEVDEQFKWEIVNWDGATGGYVRGKVRLVVLSGTTNDPAPILEPEIALSTSDDSTANNSSADNDRLKSFAAELQAWFQRTGNEAQVLEWVQR
ncbi:MAG: hypothetical protein ACI8TQ_002097 [Planctomycetota bacterium]